MYFMHECDQNSHMGAVLRKDKLINLLTTCVRCFRVLAEALCLMHERGQDGQLGAEYHVVNPKATTMGQLYGQVSSGLSFFVYFIHDWLSTMEQEVSGLCVTRRAT